MDGIRAAGGIADDRETVVIGTYESPGAYAAGHVFFVRGGNLMVQSFNEETLSWKAIPCALERRSDAAPAFPDSRSPRTARLVFLRAEREPQLTWLDRSGRRVGTLATPGCLGNLDLSPDGQQVAVDQR
jgi:hypothetical protein